MIVYSISNKVIALGYILPQLASCKDKPQYQPEEMQAIFSLNCNDIKTSDQTPEWIKSLLSDDTQFKEITQLFNTFVYRANQEFSYTLYMERLMRAYEDFNNYLEEDPNTLNPKFLKRKPLLIHLVRVLIPEVAHPLIPFAIEKNQSLKDEIEYLYDGLTVLVMMNMLIDDSADVMAYRDLVEMMSKIHKIDGAIILQEIRDKSFKESWSKSKTLAYDSFVRTAITLWEQAKSIIGEECITPSVKRGLNKVIKCMEYSMALTESTGPLGEFDTALDQFSPGMFIHIFFDLQQKKLQQLTKYTEIINTTEIQKLFMDIESAALKLARIANDIATMDRELITGGYTNTLFHLCQNKIDESPKDSTDLRSLLYTCCKSTNQEEKNDAKNEILNSMQRYNINELIHDKWQTQLQYLEECKERCRQILPEELSLAIDRLCKGNKNLLVMYMIMRKFEGAT